MHNRITEIRTISVVADQLTLLQELDELIQAKAVPCLTNEEVDSAIGAIRLDAQSRSALFLWRILHASPRVGAIRDLALDTLRANGPHRALAFGYLYSHCPELRESLVAEFRVDPEEWIRFRIAVDDIGKNPRRAMTSLVELLNTDDHELSEAVQLRLIEFRGRELVQELRRHDLRMGGGTMCAKIADEIERSCG